MGRDEGVLTWDLRLSRAVQAASGGGPTKVVVDEKLVAERVSELLKKQDLSKYVL